MAISRTPIVFVVAWLFLAGGCAKLLNTGATPLHPKNFSELQGYLLTHRPDLAQFRLRGPFAVAEHTNYEIRPSTNELFNTDLFLSTHAEKAPLVIFVHGHESSKEEHDYQAAHLASWGLHSLTLQLPNKGPWIANGKTLAKLVKFIYRSPEIFDGRIDVTKIVLVGHSFGGAAVAVALAEGAPATGGILLDPALASKDLPRYLRQIDAPMMVLGADEHISVALNRDSFYRFTRAGISEVSIKDATHEDAQYPAHFTATTEESMIAFASALTSAAFSVSATGRFDYAWASFGDALAAGKLFNAKKK